MKTVVEQLVGGAGRHRVAGGWSLSRTAHVRFRKLARVPSDQGLVEADQRLGGPIGIQGMSFGGLFAAHLAAADPRVAAVVVNGAPAAPAVPEFRTAREQLAAVVGTDDLGRVAEVMDGLRFDPAKHRIGCPLLLLHGGQDPLARYEDQQPFLQAADPTAATLRSWPDGEHTLYNHTAERDAFTADWFTDQLVPTPGSTNR